MSGGNTRARRAFWQRPIMVVAVTLAVDLLWTLCAAAVVLHFATGWGSPPPPAITVIGRDCGHVLQSDANFFFGAVYDPDQGEQCLWRAYVACQTSTLIIDYFGTDTSSTVAYTVQRRAGRCEVAFASRWSYQSMSNRQVETGMTAVCAGLTQPPSGGLSLTGCGGDARLEWIVGPRPAAQVGHVCGILVGDTRSVFSAAPPGFSPPSVASAEGCFWRAFTTCAQPATLIYDHMIPYTYPDGYVEYTRAQHTLVVEPARGGCLLTDAASAPMPNGTGNYTCASLSRATDGSLVARGCGAEGQVTIPSTVSA